ncbi:MAG TPA: pseudouridine-5'-phosphate glycosidase [Exilispira sp.]|nr:pseudouridine-5'-phosphate glycosidase [Exilispira sp.]
MGKKFIEITEKIKKALEEKKPIIALESTIITHGLPYPTNLEVAKNCQDVAFQNGAIPATIGIINGVAKVGLSDDEIEFLAKNATSCFKASTKDLGYCYAKKLNAGTTVAATLFLARKAKIDCFATGGIGGVHRNAEKTFDISADIHALSSYGGIVVCAGCKSILDIAKTIEILETYEVPVWGYKTDEFPAFYSRKSGFNLQLKAENEEEIANSYIFNQNLGLNSSILVVNPIEKSDEIPYEEVSQIIDKAVLEMEEKGIYGKEVTPFLLDRLSKLSEGRTLFANKSLIYNNVKVASKISLAIKKIKDKL